MNIWNRYIDKTSESFEVKGSSILNSDRDLFIPGSYGTSIDKDSIMQYPYLYQSLIYAICRNIEMNTSKLEWKLKNSSDNVIDKHPILDLLKNPCPFLDGAQFKSALILGLLLPSGTSYKDLGGQVFIVGRTKSGKLTNFRRGEIPWYLEVYYDKNKNYTMKPALKSGRFVGWTLKLDNNEEFVEPYEIIRVNFLNPYDFLQGVSPFTPAYTNVYQDLMADVYNTMAFENDGTIAGLLKSKTELTDEQHRKVMKQWYNRYAGAGRNSKVAVLNADIEYQQFGVTPKDMEYIEQKKVTRDHILAAYGMNKIAIGNYEDVNYATIVEGRKMLYQDTYIPIATKILDAINNQWITYINGDLHLCHNTIGIEALREDYSKQAPVYKTLVDTGVPPLMAANICGIPFTEENIKQYPWLAEKQSFGSFGGFGVGNDDEDTEDPEDEKKKLKYIEFVRDNKQVLCDRYVKSVILPLEVKLEKELEKHFDDLQDIMINNLNSFFTNKGFIEDLKLKIDDIMYSKYGAKLKLKKIFEPFIKLVMRKQKSVLESESQGGIKWVLTDQKIFRFIELRNKYIDIINNTTFQHVNDFISNKINAAYLQNLTNVELKQTIDDAVKLSIKARRGNINTIVRTETNSIAANCRVDAFKTNGIEYVEWVAYHDENTRETHIEASEAGVIPLGSLFPGVNMRWPTDPNGTLEEIINCRCVLIASEKNLE